MIEFIIHFAEGTGAGGVLARHRTNRDRCTGATRRIRGRRGIRNATTGGPSESGSGGSVDVDSGDSVAAGPAVSSLDRRDDAVGLDANRHATTRLRHSTRR